MSAVMPALPTIRTERLHLRPFTLEDAPDVHRLAGEREIAATTFLIPHPYPEGAAADWIRTHGELFEQGRELTEAVTLREDGSLVGAVSLRLTGEHRHGELAYWIGRPYWGQGYATEAGAALLEYGFSTLHLHRVHAHHMAHNPASGRVLVKIGLQEEGRLREHICKWGEFRDIVFYGILRTDWLQRERS